MEQEGTEKNLGMLWLSFMVDCIVNIDFQLQAMKRRILSVTYCYFPCLPASSALSHDLPDLFQTSWTFPDPPAPVLYLTLKS